MGKNSNFKDYNLMTKKFLENSSDHLQSQLRDYEIYINEVELYSDIFKFIENEKIKKILSEDLLLILSTNINKYFLKYCFRGTLLLENLVNYYFSKYYPSQEELTYFNNIDHFKSESYEYKPELVTNEIRNNKAEKGKYGVVEEIIKLGEIINNNNTRYNFNIKFENGDSGIYTSNYEKQNKFKVGHEVEYIFSAEKPKVSPIYNKYPNYRDLKLKTKIQFILQNINGNSLKEKISINKYKLYDRKINTAYNDIQKLIIGRNYYVHRDEPIKVCYDRISKQSYKNLNDKLELEVLKNSIKNNVNHPENYIQAIIAFVQLTEYQINNRQTNK